MVSSAAQSFFPNFLMFILPSFDWFAFMNPWSGMYLK